MLEPLVICDNLVKIYKVADLEVVALQGLDLEVMPGEMLAIVGVSGSGKTTLLNILSSLDVPSAGKCVVDGNDLTRLSQAQRIRYERFTVGHVWQQSGRNLLPELSIQDNIELPQVLGGVNSARRASRAQELLDLVGLGGMGKKRPDQLSGGEQQRAAIAVALANEPKLLLGDEPTGELDSISANEILTLLRTLNRELGLTIIIVTHDVAIASLVDRTIAIRDGRTSTETVRRDAPLEAVSEHTLATSAVIGLPSETHRESVVIDRAGRLQLPKEALERISYHGRAEIRIVNDHVELWPLGTGMNGFPLDGDQQAENQATRDEVN
ncbi:MAG TPA: ABC transporter ATP-binding protein [Ktedonobacteraceae bacterium]|nr:ABC transporter ATP-binding protein [Ktedonobacteraceae bacterium]